MSRVGKYSRSIEEEDPIRVYGTTAENAQFLTGGGDRTPSINNNKTEDIVVRIEDPNNPGAATKDKRGLDRLRVPEDAMSKDSDSLIHDGYYSKDNRYDARNCWWLHPKVRENWKIVLAAFFLLILGVGLIATGIIVEALPIDGVHGFVFFIAGAICFIPGAYHVVYVYCAVKGRRGYDFYNLPLFN